MKNDPLFCFIEGTPETAHDKKENFLFLKHKMLCILPNTYIKSTIIVTDVAYRRLFSVWFFKKTHPFIKGNKMGVGDVCIQGLFQLALVDNLLIKQYNPMGKIGKIKGPVFCL